MVTGSFSVNLSKALTGTNVKAPTTSSSSLPSGTPVGSAAGGGTLVTSGSGVKTVQMSSSPTGSSSSTGTSVSKAVGGSSYSGPKVNADTHSGGNKGTPTTTLLSLEASNKNTNVDTHSGGDKPKLFEGQQIPSGQAQSTALTYGAGLAITNPTLARDRQYVDDQLKNKGIDTRGMTYNQKIQELNRSGGAISGSKTFQEDIKRETVTKLQAEAEDYASKGTPRGDYKAQQKLLEIEQTQSQKPFEFSWRKKEQDIRMPTEKYVTQSDGSEVLTKVTTGAPVPQPYKPGNLIYSGEENRQLRPGELTIAEKTLYDYEVANGLTPTVGPEAGKLNIGKTTPYMSIPGQEMSLDTSVPKSSTKQSNTEFKVDFKYSLPVVDQAIKGQEQFINRPDTTGGYNIFTNPVTDILQSPLEGTSSLPSGLTEKATQKSFERLNKITPLTIQEAKTPTDFAKVIVKGISGTVIEPLRVGYEVRKEEKQFKEQNTKQTDKLGKDITQRDTELTKLDTTFNSQKGLIDSVRVEIDNTPQDSPKYNQLVNQYNKLLDKQQVTVDEYNSKIKSQQTDVDKFNTIQEGQTPQFWDVQKGLRESGYSKQANVLAGEKVLGVTATAGVESLAFGAVGGWKTVGKGFSYLGKGAGYIGEGIGTVGKGTIKVLGGTTESGLGKTIFESGKSLGRAGTDLVKYGGGAVLLGSPVYAQSVEGYKEMGTKGAVIGGLTGTGEVLGAISGAGGTLFGQSTEQTAGKLGKKGVYDPLANVKLDVKATRNVQDIIGRPQLDVPATRQVQRDTILEQFGKSSSTNIYGNVGKLGLPTRTEIQAIDINKGGIKSTSVSKEGITTTGKDSNKINELIKKQVGDESLIKTVSPGQKIFAKVEYNVLNEPVNVKIYRGEVLSKGKGVSSNEQVVSEKGTSFVLNKEYNAPPFGGQGPSGWMNIKTPKLTEAVSYELQVPVEGSNVDTMSNIKLFSRTKTLGGKQEAISQSDILMTGTKVGEDKTIIESFTRTGETKTVRPKVTDLTDIKPFDTRGPYDISKPMVQQDRKNILYHATSKESAKNILSQGLKPSRELGLGRKPGKITNLDAVYGSPTPEGAKFYLPKDTEGIILRVKVPRGTSTQKISSKITQVDSSIPAKNIAIYNSPQSPQVISLSNKGLPISEVDIRRIIKTAPEPKGPATTYGVTRVKRTPLDVIKTEDLTILGDKSKTLVPISEQTNLYDIYGVSRTTQRGVGIREGTNVPVKEKPFFEYLKDADIKGQEPTPSRPSKTGPTGLIEIPKSDTKLIQQAQEKIIEQQLGIEAVRQLPSRPTVVPPMSTSRMANVGDFGQNSLMKSAFERAKTTEYNLGVQETPKFDIRQPEKNGWLRATDTRVKEISNKAILKPTQKYKYEYESSTLVGKDFVIPKLDTRMKLKTESKSGYYPATSYKPYTETTSRTSTKTVQGTLTKQGYKFVPYVPLIPTTFTPTRTTELPPEKPGLPVMFGKWPTGQWRDSQSTPSKTAPRGYAYQSSLMASVLGQRATRQQARQLLSRKTFTGQEQRLVI